MFRMSHKLLDGVDAEYGGAVWSYTWSSAQLPLRVLVEWWLAGWHAQTKRTCHLEPEAAIL
jgi:hypothetical protein